MSSQTRLSVFFGVVLVLCVSILLLPSRVSTQATETCVQPPSGIIAWWPMDEPSGTAAEDIIGAHPGVHVNGPLPATGQVDGSLRLDGIDDYVGVGDSDDWAFGIGNFAIELWAKFNSPGGGTVSHPSHIFIGNDEGPGTQNKWFFALGGGFLNFHINGPVVGSHFFPLAPFSPNLNEWYHLAVTRNGNVWTIYVNGVAVGSEVRTVEVPNANAPLTIGQAEQLGFMNGLLDEVTVYKRALTQSELQAIFNAGSEGKCKTLSISTKALSAVQLGTFSTQTLEARFGSPPFNWSLVSGTLPSGMTLNSDGVLSGIPTVAGLFHITIRVTDSQSQIVERALTLDVLLVPPPSDIRINISGTVPVPGRVVDYFLVVENIGKTTTSNVNVHAFVFPDQFAFLSADPAPVDPNMVLDPNTVRWLLADLAPGEVKVITYKARLKTTVPIGSVVTPSVFVNTDIQKTLICLAEGLNAALACSLCTIDCGAAIGCWLEPVTCIFTIPLCVECAQKHCPELMKIYADDCYLKHSPASDSKPQVVKGAVDPNEKVTTKARFIHPDRVLIYPIHFENIGNAEARDVFVTDQLDPNLDSSTLNLLTPTGGSFDVGTRTVRWDLLNTNLDPGATGNVLLSIRPRPGLPSGTIIRNSATIQFEVFQPIVTNEVVNIIDSTRPASIVNPLPPQTSTLNFPISWSGSDAIGEIDFYSIFVSEDGGTFTPFLERTRDTSATFTGEVGKTYGFLAIATDTAGNIEVQPAIAETSTRVVTACSSGDIEPPTITGESVSPQALWPPDHAMREVTLNYTTGDNCSAVNCTITSITSNEPVNGTGDGDTAPDWEVVDARHVRLRAERAATGNGRTYTITITCVDSAGNSTSRNVNVFVQHDSSSSNTGPALLTTAIIFLSKFFANLL